MEKRQSTKIIAIVALVVAVVGLSVGFAAYSSTLNITSNANVQVSGNEWNVGFADTSSVMADLATPTTITSTGAVTQGTLNMLKYTLSQGTAATISSASGSSATYTFKIKNAGSIAATLESISSQGLTCAYNTTAADRVIEQDSTPNTGEKVTANTNGTITPADCKTMFSATLTIDGTDYDLNNLSNATFSGTINATSDVSATLVIAATGRTPTSVPTGDFVVSLGSTTVNYKSA